MPEKEQWYTNKELFEKILDMRTEFASLRSEMKETRETIKKYNGLREQIENLRQEVNQMKAKASGKATVFQGIREWGGWVVAILMLVITIFQN